MERLCDAGGGVRCIYCRREKSFSARFYAIDPVEFCITVNYGTDLPSSSFSHRCGNFVESGFEFQRSL